MYIPRLAKLPLPLQRRFQNIRMLIMDVDGVMTDGALMLGDDGQEYKTFYSQDGLGLKLLKSTGIELGIITGRSSQVVEKRAINTGISHVFQGVDDKLSALNILLQKTQYTPQQCAFMGDDVVDLPPMRQVGLAVAVANAHPLVLAHAHYVTHQSGGRGAVREICELIMQAHDSFDKTMAYFLR